MSSAKYEAVEDGNIDEIVYEAKYKWTGDKHTVIITKDNSIFDFYKGGQQSVLTRLSQFVRQHGTLRLDLEDEVMFTDEAKAARLAVVQGLAQKKYDRKIETAYRPSLPSTNLEYVIGLHGVKTVTLL